MKLRHPLHEFMPYGAPDLLVARRPDLSRALTVAATAAFSLFAVLGGLSALAPREGVKPEIRIIVAPIPAPRYEPQKPSGSATPPRAVVHADPRIGAIRPVERDIPQDPVIPDWMIGLKDQVQPTIGDPARIGPAIVDSALLKGDDPDKPATYAEVWPVAVIEVKPEYPDIARAAMVDGPVIVLVLVGRNGRVRDAKVDERHHSPMLDEAALTAARKWVFSPALSGGHPVAVWTAIPFKFVLQ